MVKFLDRFGTRPHGDHMRFKYPLHIPDGTGKNRWTIELAKERHGNMGEVHIGFDNTLGIKIAAKKVLEHLNDPKKIEKLKREAQVLAKIVHPNIVVAHDFVTYKDHGYLIMDYVEGQSLQQLIETKHVFAPAELVRVFKDLGSAVDHLHKHGIVHRDIKPDNVLISNEKKTMLIDFGISPTVFNDLPGDLVGMTYYKPPETLKGEHTKEPTLDVYALGVTFVECLTGEKQKTIPLTQNSKLIARLGAERVQKLEDVVRTVLAKNPEDRYKTATAFAVAVERALR